MEKYEHKSIEAPRAEGSAIANPNSPIVAVQRCEVERRKGPLWVIPLFLASGALASLLAWISLKIDIMEPHKDASVEHRLNVYTNGIAAIASGALCAMSILYCVVRRWVPRTCRLSSALEILVCVPILDSLPHSLSKDLHPARMYYKLT